MSLFPMHRIYSKDPYEIHKYCFLKSIVSAYQKYLDVQGNQEIYENLFSFCYERRPEKNRGLTIWSELKENYNDRILEDICELITMWIWNPKYFETYVNYLSKKKDSFARDMLVTIDEKEKEELKNHIELYIEEMKEEIGYEV